MKLDIKQKFAEARSFVKKHAKAAVGTTFVVLGTTAFAVFYAKNHKAAIARRAELEVSEKKILEVFGNSETIEGSGPIWDKLREIFSGVSMDPGDVWMVEANNVGDKYISFIGAGPTMEQVKITKF